jgi:hypothetical protein
MSGEAPPPKPSGENPEVDESTLSPVSAPAGYESEKLLAYLNDPMGVGVWRVNIRFKRPPPAKVNVKTASGTGVVHRTRNPADEFFLWLMYDAIPPPEGEDDEAKMIRLRRAELLVRGSAFGVSRSSLRNALIHGRRAISRLRDEGEEAAESQSAGGVIQLFRSLFPNTQIAGTEQGLELTAAGDPQQVTVVPSASLELTAISVSKESLERFIRVATEFSAHTHDILSPNPPSIEKRYTPEELVFTPYFVVLDSYLRRKHITDDGAVERDIVQAAKDGLAGKPVDSIRNSGLALEQVLAEIYEQCFREKAPNKPLGVELREIAAKAREILPNEPAPDSLPNLAHLESDIGAHIETHQDPGVKRGLVATQHLLAERRRISTRLAHLEHILAPRSKSHPFFSDDIFRSVDRAVNLRNAATHRTTQRITVLEAAAASRGLLNLVYWWSQRGRIVEDWDRPLKEVVRAVTVTGPLITLPSGHALSARPATTSVVT